MDINQAACAFGDVDPNSWGGQGLQVCLTNGRCAKLNSIQSTSTTPLTASYTFLHLQVAAISDVDPSYTSSCG